MSPVVPVTRWLRPELPAFRQQFGQPDSWCHTQAVWLLGRPSGLMSWYETSDRVDQVITRRQPVRPMSARVDPAGNCRICPGFRKRVDSVDEEGRRAVEAATDRLLIGPDHADPDLTRVSGVVVHPFQGAIELRQI